MIFKRLSLHRKKPELCNICEQEMLKASKYLFLHEIKKYCFLHNTMAKQYLNLHFIFHNFFPRNDEV